LIELKKLDFFDVTFIYKKFAKIKFAEMNGIMSDKKQYADKMTVFLFSERNRINEIFNS